MDVIGVGSVPNVNKITSLFIIRFGVACRAGGTPAGWTSFSRDMN